MTCRHLTKRTTAALAAGNGPTVSLQTFAKNKRAVSDSFVCNAYADAGRLIRFFHWSQFTVLTESDTETAFMRQTSAGFLLFGPHPSSKPLHLTYTLHVSCPSTTRTPTLLHRCRLFIVIFYKVSKCPLLWNADSKHVGFRRGSTNIEQCRCC